MLYSQCDRYYKVSSRLSSSICDPELDLGVLHVIVIDK